MSTGKEIYVERKTGDSSCSLAPTRKAPIAGKLLTGGPKKLTVFISESEKLLFKVKKTPEAQACGCLSSYKTNYHDLFIIPLSSCSQLPTGLIPPSSMNIEQSTNIKLDYLQFVQRNHSRHYFLTMESEVGDLKENDLRNLLTVVSKFPTYGIVELGRPKYGKLRGDIISEMICKERVYDVKQTVEFCTEELQVLGENGEDLFISPIIHTVQEEFTRKECSIIPDVYLVENKKTGAPVHIQQQVEASVTVFDQVQGPISILFSKDYDLSFFGMDYNSFMNSGVYDKDYLDQRRQALFVGEAERVKQRGLTMTFYPSADQWRSASNGDINILGIQFSLNF